MMAQRFFIETFGCQMNEHDSEKIAGLLTHRGLVAAASPEEADLFLLNTCSVRDKAVNRVYSRLGEMKQRKRENPASIIGVVGCVAQQEKEQIITKAPHVDLVVGTHMYYALPDLLDQIEQTRHRQVATEFLEAQQPVEMPLVVRKNRFRANITIMEGCNKHCSFCIVPFTRGKERNRPAQLVLEETQRAVDEGYVEILLLGQTVNSYRDPTNPRLRFADLLARVASVPGVKRLRFTSPHPREFDDEAIAVIGGMTNICNQVHLPLQSGSSRVLKLMRRQHTREGYLGLVERFRNCGRPLSFSTDIIVGFPGETEEDFEQTLSLVREVGFESMFSFKYSERPFTEALELMDPVAEEDKTRRLIELQQRQREIQLEIHHRTYLDQEFEVLVEGLARDGIRCCGRTTTNKVVNFPGKDQPGQFRQVLVTDVGPNSLVGSQVA